MAAAEPSLELVALVVDDQVLTRELEGQCALPSIPDGAGWTDLTTVVATSGDPGAIPVSPIRRLETEPRRFLHVLGGSGEAAHHQGRWLNRRGLDRLAEPPEVVAALALAMDEVSGRAPAPAYRPDWYRLGWRDEVDQWVDDRLAELGRTRTGPSTVLKLWSLSAVLRIPCGSSAVYVKATCDWFRAEPRITQALAGFAGPHLPTVLAVDVTRAWMLMEPLPGVDDSNPPSLAVPAARVLAELQQASIAHTADLVAAGCPDRGLAATLAALHEVITESVELRLLEPEQRAAARRMETWLAAQVTELYGCGLPITISHGDLHLGNIAYDGTDLAIFDWTDACLTHPFLDAAHLVQSHGVERPDQVWATFAESWLQVCPEADVGRARELAPLVNQVFQTISYEGIFRHREPAAQWEMTGIVARNLRELAERHAAS
ncbi:MAG: aminoglycoside phosphotransferase family protein [Propionibacteriaceae bacterium]